MWKWVIALVGLASVGTGCAPSLSQPVGVREWQAAVEEHVRTQGGGNPTVLRDVTIEGGRKGFAILGEPMAKESTDAVGLLLGHKPVGGRPAFVYLLGIVQENVVTEMRLAALSVQGQQFQWQMGNPDPAALQAYRNYRQQQWRARAGGAAEVPRAYTRFPGEDDQFELTVEGNGVRARHVQSGATWVLPGGTR